jgi:sulfite exporter TauE/SafE
MNNIEQNNIKWSNSKIAAFLLAFSAGTYLFLMTEEKLSSWLSGYISNEWLVFAIVVIIWLVPIIYAEEKLEKIIEKLILRFIKK